MPHEEFAAIRVFVGDLPTGHAPRALRLAGAAASLRVLTGRTHTHLEQVRLDRWLEPARRMLGEANSAAEWSAGQALPLERAVTEALAASAV